MTAPKVSVVLPTYNGQRYLREALDGMLAQTLKDWELILVDDCSTDQTPEIARTYAASDSRIRVIRNTVNLRLPASLNVGFAAANGDYFTWTSDDNIQNPDALRRLSDELDRYPTVGVVYSNMTLINDAGAVIGVNRVREPWALTFENPVMASFMYRREVQSALGGYATDKFLVEDWDFWLRAAKRFEFKRIDEDLYRYRYHDGALTAKRARDIMHATLQIIDEHAHELPWWNRRTAALADARRASIYATLGNAPMAHRFLARAMRHPAAIRHMALSDRFGLIKAIIGREAADRLLRVYVCCKAGVRRA